MKKARSQYVQGSLRSLVLTLLSFLAIVMLFLFLGMNLGAIGGANDNLSKIHPALQEKLSTLSPAEEVIIWVMFKDRPWSKNLAEQSAYLETHHDLPPVNEGYIHQIEGFGFRYRATSELTNEASFEGPAGQVHSLANLPLVAYVSLVEIGTALATPDSHACPGDHEYAYTTYKNRREMDAIGIVNLHNARRNGSGIKIGIIDSGIKENNDGTGKHEVFSGNVSNGQPKIAAQKDFVRNDNFADDEYGHGTAVAGVAAGFIWYNNNYAYIGAAPDAQLVIAKIADNSGTYYNDLFIKAIKWCVINQSVHIINLSVAWTSETANGYSKPTRWVDWAVKQGKVVVVSMGNDWGYNPSYRSLYAPADNFNGISVGATIPNGSVIEPYSRRGPTQDGRIKPDVVAPGGKWDDSNDSNQDSAIAAPATGATNYYIWQEGTSFAAPLVAGGIACMMEANNSLIGDPLAVRTRIWETALDRGTTGVDSIYGYGLFQATTASNNSYPNVMIRDETQGIEGANVTDLGYIPSCDLGTEPETLWSLSNNGVGVYQGIQGGDDPFWRSPSIFVDNDSNGVPDDPNQPIAGQANKFMVVVHNIGDAATQGGQVKVTLYKSNPNTGLTQWDQIGVAYSGSSIPPENNMSVGPVTWNTPTLNDLGQAHWCIGATVEYLLTRDDKAPLPGQSPAGARPLWDVVKCDNFAIRNFMVQESGKGVIATNPNLLFIVENTTSSTHTITLYKADFLPAGWTSTLSVVSIPNMAPGVKDTVTLTITSTSTGTGYVYVESHTEAGEVLGGLGFEVNSAGTLIFSDNFNDCDISNWTTYTSSGTFATTNSQYVSPPCGLYMSSMASGYAYGRTPDLYIDTTQDFTISTYFRLPHDNNHWFWVLSNEWVELVIDYGPELSAYQGTQGPTILLDSLNTNQWYHIKTVVHPATSNYDIYLDGLYKATAKFPGTYLRYLRLGEFENGSYNFGEGYWDDFLVYGRNRIFVETSLMMVW